MSAQASEQQLVPAAEGESRRARLVMGPPLGGEASSDDGSAHGEDDEDDGPEGDAGVLDDLPDDADELELTHLRLKTLRGLRIERFRQVQVSEHVGAVSAA